MLFILLWISKLGLSSSAVGIQDRSIWGKEESFFNLSKKNLTQSDVIYFHKIVNWSNVTDDEEEVFFVGQWDPSKLMTDRVEAA